MKNGSFIWVRVLGALLVLGLIVGAGAFGYRAGMAQGTLQAPVVAKAIEKAAENGQVAPQMMVPRSFGYGYSPMPFHHHGFNPIGAICGSIFFLFLFFGAMKMLFFRRMMWGGHPMHMHTPWGKPWEGGAPSMFNEWHKQAHGEQTEDEKKEG